MDAMSGTREPGTRNQTRFTRRKLAAGLCAPALLAQGPPAPIPSTPDEELKAAREANQRNADQLAKVQVALSVEPDIHFHA